MIKRILDRAIGRASLRPAAARIDRAVRNVLVETFRPAAPVSRKRHYQVRSAAELTRSVAREEFVAQPDSTIVAHPAAATPIQQPVVRGIDPAAVHFCGPFLLPPNPGVAPTEFPKISLSPPLTLSRMSDVICLPRQVMLARDQSVSAASEEWFVVDASFPTETARQHHFELEQVAPGRVRPRRTVATFERLPGRYLYLENLYRDHFGDFIADVMPLTWAYSEALALGLTGIKVLLTARTASYMWPLLEAAGIPRDAIVPLHAPVRCEEVLVATRAYMTQGYTSPVAMATWRRVRDALDRGAGPERVYFSRSRVPARPLANERSVEAIFAARGFEIVHPQDLPIAEQVTLWANARLAAGPAGSNMYGLAFQRQLKRTFLINSPNMIHFAELFLQAGYESETTLYVGRAEETAVHGPWDADIADLERDVDAWIGGGAKR